MCGLSKKLGPDRFSRLLDTNKQTDKQTDKPNLYIDKMSNIKYALSLLRRRTEYKYVFTEKRLKVT